MSKIYFNRLATAKKEQEQPNTNFVILSGYIFTIWCNHNCTIAKKLLELFAKINTSMKILFFV